MNPWKKKFSEKLATALQPESFQKQVFSFPPAAEQPPFTRNLEASFTFIDGFFIPSTLSSTLTGLSLDSAMSPYGVFLQHRISRALKEESDFFALLNGAFEGRGLFLYVPAGVKERIEIRHYLTTDRMASPRIYLYVGRGAQIEIVQNITAEKESVFCNAFFDVTLDEKSVCDFYDGQILSEKSQFFQSVRAGLKRGSKLQALLLAKGSKIARTSFKVQLLEEGSEVVLRGLSKLTGEQQNHIHTLVEHIAPHTRSRQLFKQVLEEKSRSSFEGKILVHPLAQKTEAYQLCASLPLSPDVECYAKPNLEIFADDVKASHGATVAEIKKEELFYLRSRGLSLEEARRWLIRGFCRELIDAAPIAAWREAFEASHA